MTSVCCHPFTRQPHLCSPKVTYATGSVRCQSITHSCAAIAPHQQRLPRASASEFMLGAACPRTPSHGCCWETFLHVCLLSSFATLALLQPECALFHLSVLFLLGGHTYAMPAKLYINFAACHAQIGNILSYKRVSRCNLFQVKHECVAPFFLTHAPARLPALTGTRTHATNARSHAVAQLTSKTTFYTGCKNSGKTTAQVSKHAVDGRKHAPLGNHDELLLVFAGESNYSKVS